MVPQPVDIAAMLSLFTERWAPKVVARLNDYEVKVAERGPVADRAARRRASPGRAVRFTRCSSSLPASSIPAIPEAQ